METGSAAATLSLLRVVSYLSWAETLVNVAFNAVPMLLTAATITTPHPPFLLGSTLASRRRATATTCQLRTTVWRVITSRDAGVRGRTARAPRRVQDNDDMGSEHHGDGQASDSGRHHVSHRPSTSTAWARAAFAAIVLLLSLAAPVAAGPFEDAAAAY